MLLYVSSSVLCKIILESMKDSLADRLRDEQARLRKERSCCDQTATMIIVGQTLEWSTELYLFFVDFEKAFDSVDQEVLWKILRYYGITEKELDRPHSEEPPSSVTRPSLSGTLRGQEERQTEEVMNDEKLQRRPHARVAAKRIK